MAVSQGGRPQSVRYDDDRVAAAERFWELKSAGEMTQSGLNDLRAILEKHIQEERELIDKRFSEVSKRLSDIEERQLKTDERHREEDAVSKERQRMKNLVYAVCGSLGTLVIKLLYDWLSRPPKMGAAIIYTAAVGGAAIAIGMIWT